MLLWASFHRLPLYTPLPTDSTIFVAPAGPLRRGNDGVVPQGPGLLKGPDSTGFVFDFFYSYKFYIRGPIVANPGV